MISASFCESIVSAYQTKVTRYHKETDTKFDSWDRFFSANANHTIDKYLMFRSFVSKALHGLLCDYDEAVTRLVIGQDTMTGAMTKALELMHRAYSTVETEILHSEVVIGNACRRAILSYIVYSSQDTNPQLREECVEELAKMEDYMHECSSEYLKNRLEVLKGNALDIGVSNRLYLTPGTKVSHMHPRRQADERPGRTLLIPED
jgi:hypothetical protein